MQRSDQGLWLAEAGPVTDPQPPLVGGDARADVLVIGGGYLGMWTAWRLAERGADVLLCEAQLCGHGPSGRNGGFVNSLWERAAELREMFGDDAALRMMRAAGSVVDDLEAWCDEHGVDAHLNRAPMLEVAATDGQVGVWRETLAALRELGEDGHVREVDAAGARAICDSPEFRAGIVWDKGATVHPGRLALGMRARLIERDGVRVHEHTPIAGLEDGADGVVARTAGGTRIVAGTAVLAINQASAAVRPLRGASAVASSHIVATEPVPELIDELGWSAGNGISDCRTMLHYLRTTRDGRVIFGWGGGRMGYGARRRPELDVDAEVQDAAIGHLHQLLPQLIGVRIEHGWGGPIDVSPVHLPWFGTLRSVHYGFGFTGNGVGPTVLGGHILADLAAGTGSELTALPIVGGLPPKRFPPEPWRYLGGATIRQALIRVDDADQERRRADPLARAIARVPKLLGLRLPR